MPTRRRTGKRSSKRSAGAFVDSQVDTEVRPTPFLGNMPVVGAPPQVITGYKKGARSSKYASNMAAKREADVGRIKAYYAEVAAYYSHIASQLSQ